MTKTITKTPFTIGKTKPMPKTPEQIKSERKLAKHNAELCFIQCKIDMSNKAVQCFLTEDKGQGRCRMTFDRERAVIRTRIECKRIVEAMEAIANYPCNTTTMRDFQIVKTAENKPTKPVKANKGAK